MNRPKLYQKTVDLLLQRRDDDKLVHGSCMSCAVGSICIEAAEKWNEKNEDERHTIDQASWGDIFATASSNGIQKNYKADHDDDWDVRHHKFIKQMLKLTGYTLKELMDIEYAFELCIFEYRDNHDMSHPDEAHGLKIGLKAVFYALKKIHNVNHTTHTKNLNRI